MRVLITGVAGFIGSSVAEALLRRGDQVVGIDNFNDFYDPRLKERNVEAMQAHPAFRMIRADITADEGMLDGVYADPDMRPDVVCHLAAWAGVRPSIARPVLYQEVNVGGTLRLLELSRKHEISPFVFASSSSVYGARTTVPFTEEDPVDDPVSPYAATKKAGELLGYTYYHLFGIRFIGLRFFTVYGPRQRPEMAIHLFATRIMDGEPVDVFGDGSSSRDYTYIEDIVSGVIAAIDRAVTTDGYRIYNLGGSDTTRLSALISTIESALGIKAKIVHRPDQPGDVPRTFADISRARAELGYDPRTPIREGIPKFVEWLRDRGRR